MNEAAVQAKFEGWAIVEMMGPSPRDRFRHDGIIRRRLSLISVPETAQIGDGGEIDPESESEPVDDFPF